MDPIRFGQMSSVAHWYQVRPTEPFPALPGRGELEIH
jgi:hypothetical protein